MEHEIKVQPFPIILYFLVPDGRKTCAIVNNKYSTPIATGDDVKLLLSATEYATEYYLHTEQSNIRINWEKTKNGKLYSTRFVIDAFSFARRSQNPWNGQLNYVTKRLILSTPENIHS